MLFLLYMYVSMYVVDFRTKKKFQKKMRIKLRQTFQNFFFKKKVIRKIHK